MSGRKRHLLTLRTPCRACGAADRKHAGRGLCSRCIKYHAVHGTLDDYPRLQQYDSVEIFVENLEDLGLWDQTNDQLAIRFDVSRRTIERWKATARDRKLIP